MLSTAILLFSGVMGLYRSTKAPNPFTKFSTVLLSGACLSLIVPHDLARAYAPYFMAFACFMAGFEPGNSRRLKTIHKTFFGVFGIIFAFVVVDRVLTWPIALVFWPLVLIYFGALIWLLTKDQKMLRTRMGIIIVWCGLALDHLIRLF